MLTVADLFFFHDVLRYIFQAKLHNALYFLPERWYPWGQLFVYVVNSLQWEAISQ